MKLLGEDYHKRVRTVVEFSEFVKKAEKQLGKEGREKILSLLAKNPRSGKAIERFGGIRKLEWHQKDVGVKAITSIFIRDPTTYRW